MPSHYHSNIKNAALDLQTLLFGWTAFRIVCIVGIEGIVGAANAATHASVSKTLESKLCSVAVICVEWNWAL